MLVMLLHSLLTFLSVSWKAVTHTFELGHYHAYHELFIVQYIATYKIVDLYHKITVLTTFSVFVSVWSVRFR